MMQPPQVPLHDGAAGATYEGDHTQETQQATQPSQTPLLPHDAHLWGCLTPCAASGLDRLDLFKLKPQVKIGRGQGVNDVVLPGLKISRLFLGRLSRSMQLICIFQATLTARYSGMGWKVKIQV